MKLAALIAALMTSLAALADDGLSLPKPEVLGLSLHRETGADGRNSLQFTAKDSGRVLNATFNSLGRVESFEERTQVGRLLSRQTMSEGFLKAEDYDGESSIRTVRASPGGMDRVEWRVGEGDHARTRTSLRDPWKATLGIQQACGANIVPPTDFDQRFDFSWIYMLSPADVKTDVVNIGTNIELEGCTQEQRANLVFYLQDAISRGMGCFGRLGSARVMDAARLMSFFEKGLSKPVRIVCSRKDSRWDNVKKLEDREMARASGCTDSNHPAIELNLATLMRQPNRDQLIPATLYHEMLHWLPYRHYEGVDVPYLAESCCFYAENAMRAKRACDLLKDKKLNWTSSDYQKGIADALHSQGRDDIAVETVWHSLLNRDFSSKEEILKMGDMSGLFTLGSNLLEERSGAAASPFKGLILMEAAIHGDLSFDKKFAASIVRGHEERLYPWVKQQKSNVEKVILARDVGEVLKDTVSGASPLLDSSLFKLMGSVTASACASLTASERKELRELVQLATPAVNVTASAGMAKVWTGLCAK